MCALAAGLGRSNVQHPASELDRLLSERMREMPDGFWGAAWKTVPRLMASVSRLRKPDAKAAARRDAEKIARIKSLPERTRDALRRYYIFGEAEESICASMDMTPEDFRRLRLDARRYILNHRPLIVEVLHEILRNL